MTAHKWIDRICCVALILAMLVTVLFMNGEALGIQASDHAIGYEERLFDETEVHTIDIVIDDWESFLSTCQSEEYSMCSVLIDGEAYANVGIRGKGNTSLSTVSSMDSERYSFKIEFDQYDSTKSYYGLDKLCLNNIIQDNTYMKDFLVYQMMSEFGVDAPLCSYVYITVNGENWGLYLAVEGVEDSFLQRNYGTDYGELYKPDSMGMGGGRGNGRDFDFSEWEGFEGFGNEIEESSGTENNENNKTSDENVPASGMENGRMNFPGMGGMQMPGEGMTIPEGGMQMPENMMRGAEMGGFGMGSDDVKLQYIDDSADSYSNIFGNAKTDISEADQQRLIASLKSLSEGENIEEIVNIEEVIRYFVVHNFVVNGDSYTGSMIHNYYLYEEDGQLSMIPWDYNLAFGTFQGNNAESAVNDPIDSPVSGGMEDRPMIAWIFENEEYTEVYHQYFEEFLNEFFDSGKLEELIDYTAELIAPYVEKDPTKFCTYEEFETGVETIKEFCLLRAESVAGQLDGTIPSTSDGQSADSSTLVATGDLNLSDMGTMNNSMNGGFGGGMNVGGGRGNRGGFGDVESEENTEKNQTTEASGQIPSEEMRMPEGGMQMPGKGMTMPEGGMQMPETGGDVQDSVVGSQGVQLGLIGGSMALLVVGLFTVFKFKKW